MTTSNLDATTIALLDRFSQRRWRTLDLRLRRWLPQSGHDGAGALPASAELPTDPFEQAWMLAELADSGADRRQGQHGTPRTVARELARLVLTEADPLPSAIIDPACGAGALLLAGYERWTAVASERRVPPPTLVGHDIDPLALAHAEAVLWLAAGQPTDPVGRLTDRDFLREGIDPGEPQFTVVLANPPWGVKPEAEALAAWRERVGETVASLLVGETNIYTVFLLELVLSGGIAGGFVTPIHWLHRRSHTKMRQALAASGRLGSVTVLRKRVFSDAPDMIPALTRWLGQPADSPIGVYRTGFRAPIPLPDPIPATLRSHVARPAWPALPFCAFPLLRTRRFAPLARLFHDWPRLSDPEADRPHRWLHLGDGAYKTRVRPHCEPTGPRAEADDGRWPILTRAALVGRYRLDQPRMRLTPAGLDELTSGEKTRFAGPMIALHAIKKAAAAWRLGGAFHDDAGLPLALTNNFLVGIAEAYDGHLVYPLTLLNSRLFNRLYTEQFPGVNIEAYTVGSLPFAWPLAPRKEPEPRRPTANAGPARWLAWSRDLAPGGPAVAAAVYDWLCWAGFELQSGDYRGPSWSALDRAVEAVVAGIFGLTDDELDGLLDVDPWVDLEW